MKSLRFAPLIRVSTEKQRRKGESLRTQKQQIEEVVRMKGGEIPARCWEYCGQEHATPDMERIKYKQLLRDASQGVFDAVIVADLSRWSRDNRRSKDGLNILLQNKVRFFVLHEELDLTSPDVKLRIGMTTEFNEFQASVQRHKSLLNRIQRAKRGWPATGKLPYGRTFDREAGTWGVDTEKQDKILAAAQMYLDGESMLKISKMFGMNNSNLHKTLMKRCGSAWEQRFKDEEKSIDEIVITDVPSLLPEKMIEKVRARAESNRTYTRGKIKYHYLLSSMIFCEECGYAMFGQTNSRRKRYYRHARKRKKPCRCDGLYLPADDIETAVMVVVMGNMRDEVGLKEAIERARPSKHKKLKLLDELKTLNQELEGISAKRQRLLTAVEEDAISNDDVRDRMGSLNESSAMIKSRISGITSELQSFPGKKQLNKAHERMKYLLSSGQRLDPVKLARLERRAKMSEALELQMIEWDFKSFRRLWEMDFDDKRKLLQYLFAGKDPYGKRLGAYVERRDNRRWFFKVKGIIGNDDLCGWAPMNERQARVEMGIEDENVNPFTGEVQNMHSERDAHHCLCIYK